MDALKLIPQIFFDVIARIIPGALLMLLLDHAIEMNFTEIALNAFKVNAELRKSALVWIIVVTTSAYVLGHLIAPFIRLLEKEGRYKPYRILRHPLHVFVKPSTKEPEVLKEIVDPDSRQYFPHMRAYLKTELDETTGDAGVTDYDKTVFVWYDWLRLNYPEIGALTAKIRAEYTMYGGMAVAMIVALILPPVIILSKSLRGHTPNWKFSALMIFIAIVGVPLMIFRHKDTRDTFQRSVINFYYVGKKKAEAPDQPITVNIKPEQIRIIQK
jgi:hypothetical protein